MNRSRVSQAFVLLLMWVLLASPACRIFHSQPERTGRKSSFFKVKKSPSPADESPATLEELEGLVKSEAFGASVEGRPITGFVLGEGEETVLLMGGLHGDAPGGETLLTALVERFTTNPDIASGRKLVIFPSLNPDGLESEVRANANGIDLNLNFPTSYWEMDQDVIDGAGLEPETEALMSALDAHPPDVAVLIQSPRGCIDYEGPGAREMALKVSKACHLPLGRTKAPPGSLGAYLGREKQIPLIIIELDYRHKRGVISPVEKERMINTLLDLLEME